MLTSKQLQELASLIDVYLDHSVGINEFSKEEGFGSDLIAYGLNEELSRGYYPDKALSMVYENLRKNPDHYAEVEDEEAFMQKLKEDVTPWLTPSEWTLPKKR